MQQRLPEALSIAESSGGAPLHEAVRGELERCDTWTPHGNVIGHKN